MRPSSDVRSLMYQARSCAAFWSTRGLGTCASSKTLFTVQLLCRTDRIYDLRPNRSPHPYASCQFKTVGQGPLSTHLLFRRTRSQRLWLRSNTTTFSIFSGGRDGASRASLGPLMLLI